MKVTMERSVLLKGLQRMQGVVERRSTMPVLGHILLETEGDQLSMFGTDLEIGIRTAYPAQVRQKGTATVLGRKIYEIVRELPEGEVLLEKMDNHWMFIQSGQSKFKIMGLPTEDFPVRPPQPEQSLLQIPRTMLLKLIQKTLLAVGESDTRYILNGVLMDLRAEGQQHRLLLVGTDGHRLAMCSAIFGESPRKDTQPVSVIVPKKTFQEVRKLLEEGTEDPEVGFANNQILVRQGNTILLSRLMEGTYPNYEQVIPKDNQKQMKADRGLLEGALRRVSLLSREKTHIVKMEIQAGMLSLHSNNPEMGEAREDIPVEYKGAGLTTGFNARYLLDILAVLDGDGVQLDFKDPLSPCLLREPGNKDYLCVVMPMRM